ncbi:LOB domain-containing protein 10-like [Rutidosis leptorrhynchoides]|uniref:LOB domain-containing protein 10-like n=1 Tax=Rutidosis leptorrhynchoides TaxID=125765 RepID=UPI003A99E079
MASSHSPCAACKFLRRKCTPECVYAPYFPPDQPQKFANVHKVFGASNVAKILNELNTSQREDAVNSLAYEADARLRDPVYGCVGLISILQHRLKQVQNDLHNAKLEFANYTGPCASVPNLNQGFIPQINNLSSSSIQVLPYNMQPVLNMPSQNHPQIIFEPQQQQHQQQLMAVVNSRDQQEMLRNFEQHQPPHQHQSTGDLVKLNGDFDVVVGSCGGFSSMNGSTVTSASLGLGNTYVNNMYAIQEQPQQLQEQDHNQPHIQPRQLLLEQETQQPPAVKRPASDEDRSVAPSC